MSEINKVLLMYHSRDCAMRRNGKTCNCGYIAPLTGKDKEIAKLRAQLSAAQQALEDARVVIQAYSDYHEGEYEEMEEQTAGRLWLSAHPKEGDK